MIAIPAIDIREGACVQLVGGSYDAEQVRLDDPPGVAHRWEFAGFHRLHIVDLDAATGRGSNADVIREVLRATSMGAQVGGGVRDEERIESLLRDGANRVVLGTKAVESANWLGDMAEAFPGMLIVAADVRDRHVVTRGWTRTSDRYILDFIEELNALPLAGVMVTAVHKEGLMEGTDLSLMEDVVEESEHPVCASGGIGTIGDLRALEDRGVASVVIGMALYTGAIDPGMVAEEFAE
ncbi:MAG TPA: 1-(5-phosphoribosyl)-5-[(5-phosphoribosylamino)methylideneamino] imidazole-4-carboxamide isomerase [Gemmatimonadaceae bacterium]|jgi:phosphoribosylformimino-5-aminoimidazole carboxamide ribotide isomerase|nr:1-(5-phosphoribosyl)-5-[(5-phosphoribosylamino)methylideneamino] imidazole-4-carboxamide isomerase [Gemmatimonadaceae bacterium]